MLMATKLGRVEAYNEELLPIKSRDPYSCALRKARDKLNTFDLHLPCTRPVPTKHIKVMTYRQEPAYTHTVI